MKRIFKYSFFALIFFAFITCKKYDEGGFIKQTNKHLFGHNKVGSSKTWKLKLYEVNGIDSTYLIQGANTIPDFYEKFVTFKYEAKEVSVQIIATTFSKIYGGSIDKTDKIMLIGMNAPISKNDSMQCNTINNQLYCVRNILFPEYNNYAKQWNIKKLTKNELILETNWKLKNSYKIILTQ